MSFPNRKPRPPKNPADALTHGNCYQYERGCRCDDCRRAYSVYRRDRYQQLKQGKGDYFVSAEICRKHLLWLQSKGIGKNAVADASGIDEPRLRKIRNGTVKRSRMSTEQRIMRVDTSVRLDGSLVPAYATLKKLSRMRAMGYTLEQLARMLGYKSETIQFSTAEFVTARTEFRVARLYMRVIAGVTNCRPADYAIVPGERTWEQIDMLVQMGYRKSEIWRMLGNEGTTLRISKRGVRVQTARAVDRLYYELAEKKPRRAA